MQNTKVLFDLSINAKGDKIMNVLRFKAWDANLYSDGKKLLCEHSRRLETVDLFSKNIIASRKGSKDYYVSEFVIEEQGIVIALCVKKNQVDILSLNELSLMESVSRKGSKKYIREKCVIDNEKKNIYSILYADELRSTIITKFHVDTYEEEVIAEFEGRYLFDILYVKKERNCMLGGIHFYGEEKNGVVGEYEIFSLDDFSGRTVLKELAKSSYAHLEKIGRTESGETLIYYSEKGGSVIHNLTRDEEMLRLPHDSYVTFSENGKYIAYIEADKKKFRVHLYSIISRKVFDELEMEYIGLDLMRNLRFQNGDKQLTFQQDEIVYILDLNI